MYLIEGRSVDGVQEDLSKGLIRSKAPKEMSEVGLDSSLTVVPKRKSYSNLCLVLKSIVP